MNLYLSYKFPMEAPKIMEYSFETIEELLASMRAAEEIKITDIPCVDLYMDQVTTLFDDRLARQKRDDSDVVLTKTMINNYAKAKILPPIKNKKYNKQQIILLILIYNLKQTLSLEDIKALLDPILNNLASDEKNPEFLDLIYDKFLEVKEQQSDFLINNFIDKMRTLEKDAAGSDNEQLLKLLMSVLTLISSANIQKRMAEKIIDTYFKSK